MKINPISLEFAKSGEQRFWGKVTKGDSCWEWTASKWDGGYGRFVIEGRSFAAHRVSWILSNGEIEDGKLICHKCDNRGCVRPDHLFMGTHQENIDDCIQKGRARKAVGEKNKKSKLTPLAVRVARRLRNYHGFTIEMLAGIFRSSLSSMCSVLNGETWKHVPMP